MSKIESIIAAERGWHLLPEGEDWEIAHFATDANEDRIVWRRPRR